MKKSTRIFIIASSGTARKNIFSLIDRKLGLSVCGTAPDVNIGLAKVSMPKYRPDIIILELFSLEHEYLRKIDNLGIFFPMIIISSFHKEDIFSAFFNRTQPNFSFQAMRILEVRDVEKNIDDKRFQVKLNQYVFSLAQKKRSTKGKFSELDYFQKQAETKEPTNQINEFSDILIIIGASAGSTEAILFILSEIPPEYPPILIIIHSNSEDNTSFFVKWLITLYPYLDIQIAVDGQQLSPKQIYFAPGDKRCVIQRRNKNNVIRIDTGNPDQIYKPSINEMFSSSAEIYKSRIMGIVLSGLNASDVLDGARKIIKTGGVVITEHESTSKLTNMPKSVHKAGLSTENLPLYKIPAILRKRGFI